METSEFKSINDVAGVFPGIKIKKMKEFVYNKSDVGLYAKELKENGYVLLRNVLSKSQVQAAASVIDDYLINNNYMKIEDDKELMLKNEGVLLSGLQTITHHPKFLNTVESNDLKNLFSGIFGEESYTLDTKWVRVLGSKEYTDVHSDLYRFKRLGLPLYTCWIPLMDQGIKEGTLGICQDSFKLDYEGEDLGDQELPKDFLDIVDESSWLYSDYKMGDVVIFDIRTIHASFRNDSDQFRRNTDTRWLPKRLAKQVINI